MRPALVLIVAATWGSFIGAINDLQTDPCARRHTRVFVIAELWFVSLGGRAWIQGVVTFVNAAKGGFLVCLDDGTAAVNVRVPSYCVTGSMRLGQLIGAIGQWRPKQKMMHAITIHALPPDNEPLFWLEVVLRESKTARGDVC